MPAFASATEQYLARDLRTVLQNVDVGDHIVDSDDLREAMSTLEYFIPQVLREIHPEWKHESLDAVFPEIVTKKAKYEIEIIGTCIIISDQTMVPTYNWIRVSATDDVIESAATHEKRTGTELVLDGSHGCAGFCRFRCCCQAVVKIGFELTG